MHTYHHHQQPLTMSAAAEEAEWDTSKENFVPVKQGRPTSALVTPLSVRKQDQELDEAKRCGLRAAAVLS